VELDDTLKEKIRDLGLAISSGLSDAPQIAAAIGAIKESGYDVMLVLEATIGLSHNSSARVLPLDESSGETESETLHIRFTPSDKQFLESMRIKLDESAPAELSDPRGE